mmetsp:Transcript_62201/g.158163  ORF Transcript_62201/g.158163 Transcript_62201/m.158163 type:complete len:81 (+) Transcript_62201:161-403(+)
MGASHRMVATNNTKQKHHSAAIAMMGIPWPSNSSSAQVKEIPSALIQKLKTIGGAAAGEAEDDAPKVKGGGAAHKRPRAA